VFFRFSSFLGEQNLTTEFNCWVEDEISWTKDETSQLEEVVREKTAQIAALVGGLDAMQVRRDVYPFVLPLRIIMFSSEDHPTY
jgi:hypothetical protein